MVQSSKPVQLLFVSEFTVLRELVKRTHWFYCARGNELRVSESSLEIKGFLA
jgi:hypothetical protein